jgi:hypothetical protein
MADPRPVREAHIARFPDYRFGSDGSVWTRRVRGHAGMLGDWKPMRPSPGKDGYLFIRLFDATGRRVNCQVHRLILEAFVGPCPRGKEACHDPDPTPANCRLENLRWGTRTSNHYDRYRHARERVIDGNVS